MALKDEGRERALSETHGGSGGGKAKAMTIEQQKQKRDRQAAWAREKRAKAKGEKPAAKKPAASAKPAKARGSSKLAARAVAAVGTAAKVSTADAIDAAVRIVKGYDRWQKATGALHDVSKEQREKVGAAEASFSAAIEEASSIAGSTEEKRQDAASRLMKLQGLWQEWRESIAGAAEERKGAKEKRREAAKGLERAIEEGRQLVLPSMS